MERAAGAPLSRAESAALLSIVQEALNNVVKHAGTSDATVRLRLRPPCRLEIEDRGRGFDPERADDRGMGLDGMRERAAEIGWSLTVDSSPGAGTRVVRRSRGEREVATVTQSERIRVVIVDDHQVVRLGLRTFLDLQDDIEVVGEAGDGLAAIDLASRLQPDVMLMDILMPRLDGIAATRRIKEAEPGIGVIALTSFAGDDQVLPALEAGASSYLLKDVTPEELVEAIRAVHRGEPRLHPDALRKVMEAAMGARPDDARPSPRAEAGDLTERELEVVALVAQGRSNREIADAFVISEKTVKTHIGHVLAKLGLKDRTQLAIYALKHGLAGEEAAR